MVYKLKTSKPQEFIAITDKVMDEARKSNVQNGIAVVFVPHTTAGVTINENTDPDVVRDMISVLNKAYPIHGDYLHSEGNSHAHIMTDWISSYLQSLLNL